MNPTTAPRPKRPQPANPVFESVPLTPGMYATVAARLPQATLHDSIVTGRRYGGAEALVAGIVEHIAAESDVLARFEPVTMIAKPKNFIEASIM